MKLYSFLLPLALISLLLSGCSGKISETLLSEITEADADSVIVKPDKALFIFNINGRDTWEWHQENTAVGQPEYGWWAEFELNNEVYTCGYRLLNHHSGDPAAGSFKQLIEAGNVDITSETTTSTEGTGSNEVKINIVNERLDDASIEAKVHSNHLIIILEEQEIIDKFRDIRPTSLILHKQTAVREFERSKVKVSYSFE